MTREEQLVKVKQSLNITGDHLDATLGIFLDDVKYYMTDAGVSTDTVDSESAIGCICRGVSDLYINNEFSQYFYQRVSQLAISSSGGGGESVPYVVGAKAYSNYNGMSGGGEINLSDGTTVEMELLIPTVLTVTCEAGSEAGKTVVTIDPPLTAGNKYRYRTGSATCVYNYDLSDNGTEWDGVSEISALNGQKITVFETSEDWHCRGIGTGVAVS